MQMVLSNMKELQCRQLLTWRRVQCLNAAAIARQHSAPTKIETTAAAVDK